MAIVDTNRGAKRAREARAALGLPADAPLRCVLTVVEERVKLPVIVAPMPDGVAGACFRAPRGAVLWVNGEQPAVRQRFTLAHELGHVWCKHDGALEVDRVQTLSGRTTNAYEIQANAFAAEFLVPRACLEAVVEGEPTLEEVAIIARHCGVSAIVVVYRLKQLRLATEDRITRLEGEIDERLHEQSARPHAAPARDRLGGLAHLPYLSPALHGTQLAAAVRGEGAGASLAGAVHRLLG